MGSASKVANLFKPVSILLALFRALGLQCFSKIRTGSQAQVLSCMLNMLRWMSCHRLQGVDNYASRLGPELVLWSCEAFMRLERISTRDLRGGQRRRRITSLVSNEISTDLPACFSYRLKSLGLQMSAGYNMRKLRLVLSLTS